VVAGPQLERVHPQPLRQLVDRDLHAELALRRAVPAVGAADRQVGVQRRPMNRTSGAVLYSGRVLLPAFDITVRLCVP
jgi:hypothetical protein